MQKRIGIFTLGLVVLISGGVNPAQAVNSPNPPANVSVSSNSSLNSLPTSEKIAWVF
jgi:hypothetical protein